jgi:hypothetical protein
MKLLQTSDRLASKRFKLNIQNKETTVEVDRDALAETVYIKLLEYIDNP